MEEDEDVSMATPPLCQACQHYHYQGTKCDICGHVGQSHLYTRMCEKAIELSKYRVEAPPIEATELTLFYNDISKEIRRQVFVEEQGVIDTEEFDEYEDSSRSLVGFLGDLPIWTARWRFLPCARPCPDTALIDRLALLPDYRKQNVSDSSIHSVYKDIYNVSSQLGYNVTILSQIPQGSWLQSKVEARGFDVSNTCFSIRNGVTYVNARLIK